MEDRAKSKFARRGERRVRYLPVVADSVGAFSFPAPLPRIPTLAGLPLTMQVVLFGTAGPLGVDLSNGARVTLGY